MAVVTIGRDPLVAFFRGRFQPDHNGLLPDVQVAEAADQAHAVKLPRLFFEAADQ